MAEKPVITIEDITAFALKQRRPGCEKGVLHDDAPVQTAMYRVQPGSGVPTHEHAQVYDHFIGIKGLLEIRYEGERGNGVFVLSTAGAGNDSKPQKAQGNEHVGICFRWAFGTDPGQEDLFPSASIR